MKGIAALLLALGAASLSGASPAAASAQDRAAEAAASHLVVYNRLGPNWARRESAMPVLLAHRDIYRRLAEEGEIIFSGRLDGEPPLGMAMFRGGVDEVRIRRLLQSDPAVIGGYITLEFRRFEVAFGAVASRPAASPSCRGHLATISQEGVATAGTKSAVHDAAATGEPLRVGWGLDTNNDGTADLVHWADATFVTTWQNQVFVQIAPIHRQSPVGGRPEVRLPEQLDFWSASLGTNGRLVGRLHSGQVNEMPVTSWWCRANPER